MRDKTITNAVALIKNTQDALVLAGEECSVIDGYNRGGVFALILDKPIVDEKGMLARVLPELTVERKVELSEDRRSIYFYK